VKVPRSSTVPEVHSFPSDDDRFRSVVAKTCELYSPVAPDALAELLRPAYPTVTVRERDGLARLDNDLTEVWYVFRDGEVVGNVERDRAVPGFDVPVAARGAAREGVNRHAAVTGSSADAR